MSGTIESPSGRILIEDPPFARFLFSDTRSAPLWLLVRIPLGLSWLSAGWGKLQNPAWVETGMALRGFWEAAVQVPEDGRAPIAYDWYRNFIQGMLDAEAYVWFAKLIALGETLIGIALIIGAFVGIAAFFGAFMNWNFIMAGSASTNGLLFALSIFLILGWKVAGYYGLDYYLLRYVGVPWERGEHKVTPLPTAAS